MEKRLLVSFVVNLFSHAIGTGFLKVEQTAGWCQALAGSGERKRGYQRWKWCGKCPPEHGDPDLDQLVGAAAAPTRGLFLGHALADDPVDPRFDHGGGDALTPKITLRIRFRASVGWW